MEKKPYRTSGVNFARVINVIETDTAIGTGAEEDPVRIVRQYFDLDGKLLAKCDSFLDGVTFQQVDVQP